MLMLMKSQTEAMRALAYTAAAALDLAHHHPAPAERAKNQALVDLLIPIVKGWCTERAVEIASLGVQIHGGMGFIEESGAAQFYRDARITTIYEGTTGIQALDLVGRKVASERGATLRVVLAEVARLQGELEASGDADLAAIRARLAAGTGALAAATDWVVASFGADGRQAAASAVPFLELAGVVFGGAAMARAALLARRRLDAGEGDPAFYHAKLKTARFYAEHILPQASALAHTVTDGAAVTLELSEAQF
jgi:acyl-CoA dehydrogenase